MGSVVVLPWVLVPRTSFGTRIKGHRGPRLLARDAAGRCHALGPAELRRCYPEAWPAWVRLAALLRPDEVGSRQAGPPGGAAA
jgi:hypothetical protein